ncbi:MAG: hypothetical protein J6N21_19210, partial [Butyrivibrio sp.]|nr:hypothetical protein [Butyrivibrio sp.]
LESISEVLNPDTYMVLSVDEKSECNEAVAASIGTEFEGADILLLKAGVYLVFDALYFLRYALHATENRGAVGSMSNKAENEQKAKVKFSTPEEYIKYGERVNVPVENACIERENLSDFCMLIRRDVWEKVGGINENIDSLALSLKISGAGYALGIVKNSFVYRID